MAEEEPTCGAVHQRDGGIGRYGLPLHLHLELRVEVLHLPHRRPVPSSRHHHLLVARVPRERRRRARVRGQARLLGQQLSTAPDLDLLPKMHDVVPREVEHSVLLVPPPLVPRDLERVASARLGIPRRRRRKRLVRERLLRVARQAAVRRLIEEHHGVAKVHVAIVGARLQRNRRKRVRETLLGLRRSRRPQRQECGAAQVLWMALTTP